LHSASSEFALPGNWFARHQQRIGDARDLARQTGARQALQLRIEEGHVERGVVDHDLSVAQVGQQFVGHLGKTRLVGKKLVRQAMDLDRIHAARSLGIEVEVLVVAGEPAVDHLEAADLDDAVAALWVESGGLGVEEDLAHEGGFSRSCRRAAR
jgi:hypothetical protein